MTERYRQEVTDWDTVNHIYITEGRTLVGYIPKNTNKEYRFSSPMRNWSASKRKFRDLTKKDLEELNIVRIQMQNCQSY